MATAPGGSEQGKEKITGRLAFIVSRDRPEVYNYLMSHFAGEKDVEVILDRRRGGRRQHEPERRQAAPDQSNPGSDPLGFSSVVCRRLEAESPGTVQPVEPLAPLNREPPGPNGPLPRGQAILVVDDEPAVAALWAEVLTRQGHEVDVAANGAIALTKLRERVYELILCDLQMPELDGLGLYREVLAHNPEMARRFIFITGSALTPEVTKFLKQTGVPSLPKPCDLDELWRVVQKMLPAAR